MGGEHCVVSGEVAVETPTIAILLAITSVLLVAFFSKRSGVLRKIYFSGVSFWSQWMPVLASAAYLGFLASNVTQLKASPLYMGDTFNFVELIGLFLVGPLFLTRVGNILATATLIYCFQHFILDPSSIATAPIFVFTAALTTIAILGDKMPWIPQSSSGPAGAKLRDAMLAVLTLGAMGVLVATVIKIYAFNRWLGDTVGVEISVYITMGLLLSSFMGWLLIALGMSRSIALPILSLPTTIALAFITGWGAYMLVIPFTMCLAFTLTSSERRTASSRRSTYRPGQYAYGR